MKAISKSKCLPYFKDPPCFLTKLLPLIFLTTLILSPRLCAQQDDIEFEHISYEEGLADNWIYCIFQDSKGFMWFGTYNGLNRYDGYRFTVFKPDPEESHSSSNLIKSICEDSYGVLWIGTNDGGLYTFNREKEEYHPCKIDQSRYYRNDQSFPIIYALSNVKSIYEDRSGILWIGTNGALSKLDRKRNIFVHYKIYPGTPQNSKCNAVNSIYEDHLGVLWIGTNGGGLNKFDREKEVFIHYKNIPNEPLSLSNDFVWSIYEDHLGILWIGTAGGGLNRFDREKEKFFHYQNDPNDNNSLSDNFVYSIYEDQSGVLWIGTSRGGLNRFDRAKERFTHYRKKDGLPNEGILVP